MLLQIKRWHRYRISILLSCLTLLPNASLSRSSYSLHQELRLPHICCASRIYCFDLHELCVRPIMLLIALLLRCSAIRQVPGSQALHPCRSSALLFISPYRSFSIKSSIIPIRFLPGPLFPSIFPSITSFISPSPLIICPIQFFLLRIIVSTMDLFSPTPHHPPFILIAPAFMLTFMTFVLSIFNFIS